MDRGEEYVQIFYKKNCSILVITEKFIHKKEIDVKNVRKKSR